MVHVIKVYLEDEKNEQKIRRLAVGSDVVCSFSLLKEKIKDLFELSGNNMEMKWKDPENDFIILSSDGELAQALANAEDGLLKIFVFLKKEGEVKSESPKPKKPVLQHPYVVCDGCEKQISGDRYKCLQCKDYDICSGCNAADKHPQHDLIKLVRPINISREWVYLGSRKMWRSMFGRCPGNFHQYGQAPQAPRGETANSPTSTPPPFGQAFNLPPIPDAIGGFLKGDFVEAQKLFSEGFGNFLKHLPGVEVKLENCPFKTECKVNMPKTEDKASNPSAPDQAIPAEAPKPKAEETSVKERVKVEVTSTAEAATSTPDDSTIPPVSSPPGLFSNNDVKEPSPAMEESAEGWTFLHGDKAGGPEACAAEAKNNEAAESEKVVTYPSLVEEMQSAPKDTVVQTTDPLIISAIMTMQAMGFTNEGGWLERLLLTKNGNINEALDALYPGARL